MHRRLAATLGPSGTLIVPRRVMIVILAAIYALAFVLSPYWSLMPAALGQALVLALTVIIGAAWSYYAAADTDVRGLLPAFAWMLVFVLLLGVLNAPALTAVIPWRGDETTFITRTRDLVDRVPLWQILVIKVLLLVILAGVALRARLLTIMAVTLELAAVGYILAARPFDGVGATVMIRWPYFNYWLYAGPPMLAHSLWDSNHEFLYRLLPLASAAGLTWAVHRRLAVLEPLPRLLWALACATIPLVLYYTSVLYIDVTAMFLMTVVSLEAETLLSAEPRDVMRKPAWLALLLLGFLKDTAIVFLACFILCRLIFRVAQARAAAAAIRPALIAEARLILLVSAPYLVYSAFRFYLASIRTYTRGFSPDFARLLQPDFYSLTWRAWTEQFGLFFILFVIGMLLLLVARQYRSALLAGLLFIAVPVFFAIDRGSAGLAGYSRFNLFVLPAIIAASMVAIERIAKWGRIASLLAAALVIAENTFASPLYPDGTKHPYWGNYQIDVSEHYYPYDQALLWLKQNHAGERVLFSPMFYRYYLSFYFSKYDYHPDYDILIVEENAELTGLLGHVLAEAERGGFDLVLFQPRNGLITGATSGSGFCLEKAFANQAHSLLLFSRRGPCPAN